MQDTPDIGSIVSMIMENPRLVSEIAEMAKARESKSESDEASAPVTAAPEPEVKEDSGEPRRLHRIKLANAMKPYLSKERARAIDAMMSIADILDITIRRG